MIDYTQVTLGALNVFQALALAWLGIHAQRVKNDLEAHNGEHAEAIAQLRREMLRSRNGSAASVRRDPL